MVGGGGRKEGRTRSQQGKVDGRSAQSPFRHKKKGGEEERQENGFLNFLLTISCPREKKRGRGEEEG